jgi:integral membrane protein (TIGR01906 family)
VTGDPRVRQKGPRPFQLPVPLVTWLLPFVLLASAIRLEMSSVGLYLRGFRMYSVAEFTGLTLAQLTEAATRLVLYFNTLAQTPQMVVTHVSGSTFDLYHDYELIHLADVKVLFAINSMVQSVSLLLVVTLILAGLAFGRKADVRTALRRGSVLTLLLLGFTALAFVLDFQRMFVLFHLAAFDNSFWLLDPLTDYLVMLFPLGFWQDMFLLAGAGTGLMALGVLALTMRKARPPHGPAPHVTAL